LKLLSLPLPNRHAACGDKYQVDLSNALVYDQLRVSKSGIRVKPCFAQCPTCVEAEMHHVWMMTEPKVVAGCDKDAELRAIRDRLAELELGTIRTLGRKMELFVVNAKKVIKDARNRK